MLDLQTIGLGAPYTSANITIVLINGAAPFPMVKRFYAPQILFTNNKDDYS